MLLTHIPAATTQPNCRPALRQEDYPNVRFWTRHAWNSTAQEPILEIDAPEEGELFPDLDEEGEGSKEHHPGPANVRGKHRSSQGINVTMKYIELEDGEFIMPGFVDTHTVSTIPCRMTAELMSNHHTPNRSTRPKCQTLEGGLFDLLRVHDSLTDCDKAVNNTSC